MLRGRVWPNSGPNRQCKASMKQVLQPTYVERMREFLQPVGRAITKPV
jgi:hypothetical protein